MNGKTFWGLCGATVGAVLTLVVVNARAESRPQRAEREPKPGSEFASLVNENKRLTREIERLHGRLEVTKRERAHEVAEITKDEKADVAATDNDQDARAGKAPSAAPSNRELSVVRWIKRVSPSEFRKLDDNQIRELKSLSLKDADIDPKSLRHLTELPALESIDFRRGGLDDAWIRALPDLSTLRGLRLRGPGVTDEGVALLHRFPSLRELDLTETSVTIDTISRLPNQRLLTTLRLNGLAFTDADVERLAGMTALVHLEVDRTPLTDHGLERIGALLPGLRRLEIRRTKVTREAVDRFRQTHPRCEIVTR